MAATRRSGAPPPADAEWADAVPAALGGDGDLQRRPRIATTATSSERGVVVRFSQAKGYGFVLAGDGTEVFVHQTEIVTEARWRTLRPGQAVTYQRVADARGVRARGVRLLPSPATTGAGPDDHDAPEPSTPSAETPALGNSLLFSPGMPSRR